jgi:hypothetical protein
MSHGFRGVVCFTTFLLAFGTASAQDVKLRYQYKEGDKLAYVLEQSMVMDIAAPGMNTKLDAKIVFDMTWLVKSVDKDGKAQLVQTIDRVQLDMNGPVGAVKYDSKQPKEPDNLVAKQIAALFQPIIGAEIGLAKDARGQMSDIKLSDKFKESLKANAAAVGQLADLVSDDGMKKIMEQSGLVFPEEAIKKGFDWTQRIEMKSASVGKSITTIKNLYEGQEDRNGKKLEKITLLPTVAIEPAPNAPLTLVIKSQENKGTALFDNTTGRLVEISVVQDMAQEGKIMGQTITQKVKVGVVMQLQK